MRTFLASAALAAAIPTTAGAGELHLLGLVQFAYAVDVSADGRVVSGYDPGRVWYWTLDTWVMFVDGALPPGNGVGGSVLVTGDGQRLMCSTLQGEPQKSEPTFFEIASQTFDPAISGLGFHCDISRASPWDMTADGRFVCGLVNDAANCNPKGYVWDAATDVMSILPTVYFYKPTRGNAVSEDGSLVVGWSDDYVGYRQGSVWRRDASGNYVQTLMNTGVATVKMREAGACSGNGQWAYGEGRSDVSGGAPYRWSAATGYQPIIPAPAGVGTVTDANFDGSKVLTVFGGTTFIWFADRGYVPIATWAAEHGVTLPPEWALRGFAMTDDALTIVGHAIREDAAQSPFVLDLRPSAPPCPADLNDDGAVNGDDLGILLGNWGACASTECPGDFDQNGSVDADDLGILLAAWGACPA
jgi:hypothetical protein